MKKHKNGDFLECKICGNIFEYIDDKIDCEFHHNTGSSNTVLRYIKCPDCQSLILIDRQCNSVT